MAEEGGPVYPSLYTLLVSDFGEPGFGELQRIALPLGECIVLLNTNKSVFFVSLAKRVCMKSACHPQAYLGK